MKIILKEKLIEFVNKMVSLFYGFMGVFTLALLGFLINCVVEKHSIETNRKDSLKHIECLNVHFTQEQCNLLNNK